MVKVCGAIMYMYFVMYDLDLHVYMQIGLYCDVHLPIIYSTATAFVTTVRYKNKDVLDNILVSTSIVISYFI